jgi:crotonobetainyl-CoA:carnitine CoA-transferase CaiB-like acyl-CoA transferase
MGTATRLPLDGVRVLDLGMYFAGPICGALLGDMGAEVIKVESPRRPDPLRLQARGLFPESDPGVAPWNRSGMVNERNRNKLGLSLDLSAEDGRDLFLRLVAVSDVVLENFSVGVLDRLGVGYPRLRAANPGIILASISSQGLTGPEREYISFGPVLEEISGLASLTGFADIDQLRYTTGLAFPDPLGGAMGASAILSALVERQRTGNGAHIDLSQRQAASMVVGEFFLDYAMNRRVPPPRGNRHPAYAPAGYYRCAGEDAWAAITVHDDAAWQRLCGAIEREDLGADPRYATVSGRAAGHDQLDSEITRWTSGRDPESVTARLQAVDVAAAPVLDAAGMFHHSHYRAREFWEDVEQFASGRHAYRREPVRYGPRPVQSRQPAPGLGEHTAALLHDLLGPSDAEVERLAACGTTGTEPRGAAQG